VNALHDVRRDRTRPVGRWIYQHRVIVTSLGLRDRALDPARRLGMRPRRPALGFSSATSTKLSSGRSGISDGRVLRRVTRLLRSDQLGGY